MALKQKPKFGEGMGHLKTYDVCSRGNKVWGQKRSPFFSQEEQADLSAINSDTEHGAREGKLWAGPGGQGLEDCSQELWLCSAGPERYWRMVRWGSGVSEDALLSQDPCGARQQGGPMVEAPCPVRGLVSIIVVDSFPSIISGKKHGEDGFWSPPILGLYQSSVSICVTLPAVMETCFPHEMGA
jgi:hypothetical protein